MSFSGAVSKLQALALSMDGIKSAPDFPPESINVYPFSVAYPASGRIAVPSFGLEKGLHTVFVEIHCNRTLLPKAVEQATNYLVQYPKLLASDPTLGGEVDTIQFSDSNPLTYEFGRLEWNTIPTVGVRFTITFKLHETL